MTDRIMQNEIQCLKCMDIIYSSHRWDFKRCGCGAVAVDGGTDYLRRLGNLDDWEDRSIVIPMAAVDAMKAAVTWADNTGRNELGTAMAVMRAMRDHGLLKDDRVLRGALSGLLTRYVDLVNCGDCGNWDPEIEPEVAEARAALAVKDEASDE